MERKDIGMTLSMNGKNALEKKITMKKCHFFHARKFINLWRYLDCLFLCDFFFLLWTLFRKWRGKMQLKAFLRFTLLLFVLVEFILSFMIIIVSFY
jgi:hypothetical protein